MTDDTAAHVRSLHPQLKRKIKTAIQIILDDPLSGKALKDDLLGLRSFRVGKFRIIYAVLKGKEVLEIAAVGPRRRIYEETYRLIQKEQSRQGCMK